MAFMSLHTDLKRICVVTTMAEKSKSVLDTRAIYSATAETVVKDIKGTSVEGTQPNWIEYMRKLTGESKFVCAVPDCRSEGGNGAHVLIRCDTCLKVGYDQSHREDATADVKKDEGRYFIVPVCSDHHSREKTFTIRGGCPIMRGERELIEMEIRRKEAKADKVRSRDSKKSSAPKAQ
ncbi:MAG: hypothetical protein WC107_07575 [Patescibacteria group bacterium]